VKSNPPVTGTKFTRSLGVLSIVSMTTLVLFGLVFSPADKTQKDSVRMMYIHVPSVWVAYLAFIVTAVAAAAYLWPRTRSLTWDRVAGASAEVGIVFMVIALVSGSLWGRITWGRYWAWDARLTTTAFLFVTYLGYLAVRSLGGTHQQRATRSGIVALLAVLEIPLVHFSVVIWRGLHQEASLARPDGDIELENLMLFSLLVGLVAFTAVYVWLVLHRQRVLALEDMADDAGLDAALVQRREEAALL
jgi:heme exporter protein C